MKCEQAPFAAHVYRRSWLARERAIISWVALDKLRSRPRPQQASGLGRYLGWARAGNLTAMTYQGQALSCSCGLASLLFLPHMSRGADRSDAFLHAL